MLKTTPDTIQLIISDSEKRFLYKEMERAFVLMDRDTEGGMYHSSHIERDFPLMGELFRKIFSER